MEKHVTSGGSFLGTRSPIIMGVKNGGIWMVLEGPIFHLRKYKQNAAGSY